MKVLVHDPQRAPRINEIAELASIPTDPGMGEGGGTAELTIVIRTLNEAANIPVVVARAAQISVPVIGRRFLSTMTKGWDHQSDSRNRRL